MQFPTEGERTPHPKLLCDDRLATDMTQIPRSSSLVENLNSRLRNYFPLRRHLGGSYLGLLRFFVNLALIVWQPCRRANDLIHARATPTNPGAVICPGGVNPHRRVTLL